MYLLALAATVSLVARLRLATGVERQQIKCLTYAGAVLAGSTGLYFVVSEATDVRWFGCFSHVLEMVGIVGLPVAVGFAVLKYRLYNIDHLINRTLVYASLTAVLVLEYVGGVVLLQELFQALTGKQSQLAVVVSAMAIAALFNPLRRRIQGLIDRRFYRRKYDAAKTLESYSAKLRTETDVEALNSNVLAVVQETMQLALVSLWLRPDADQQRNGESDQPRR